MFHLATIHHVDFDDEDDIVIYFNVDNTGTRFILPPKPANVPSISSARGPHITTPHTVSLFCGVVTVFELE